MYSKQREACKVYRLQDLPWSLSLFPLQCNWSNMVCCVGLCCPIVGHWWGPICQLGQACVGSLRLQLVVGKQLPSCWGLRWMKTIWLHPYQIIQLWLTITATRARYTCMLDNADMANNQEWKFRICLEFRLRILNHRFYHSVWSEEVPPQQVHSLSNQSPWNRISDPCLIGLQVIGNEDRVPTL